MEVTIRGSAQEIAALVIAVQERRSAEFSTNRLDEVPEPKKKFTPTHSSADGLEITCGGDGSRAN